MTSIFDYSLINIAQQCCDADEYIDMGYVCAQTGYCYNSLRPIGDSYWFGLPYFLNASENIFFYLHLFLFFLVGATFFYLLKIFPSNTLKQDRHKNLFNKLIAALLFLILLASIVWPTFFNTLSDTPATLLVLEAILLTLIATIRGTAAIFFIAGIFLGVSALLRTAYFTPLCLAGIALCLSWCWYFFNKRTRVITGSLLIPGFIIPLMFQYYSTWKHTGEWQFLSEARNQSMMSLHLDSTNAGYDTGLQQTKIFWLPSCTTSAGLLPSLKAGDIASAACIVESRLQFYLASYAAKTYIGTSNRNFLDNDFAEQIGHRAGWSLQNLSVELNAAISPLGDKTASHLSVMHNETKTENYFQTKTLTPLPPGQYRYSIWMWTTTEKKNLTVNVELENIALSNAAYVTHFHQQSEKTITETPQQLTLDVTNPSRGYLVIRIGTGTSEHNTPKKSDDEIYAWGAILEPASSTVGYMRKPNMLTEILRNPENNLSKIRIFSTVLCVLNIFALLTAAICLLKFWKNTHSPAVIFVGALLLAIFFESLLIIPEQRYFQAVLGVSWSLSILFLFNQFLLWKSKSVPNS